jgi:hypothetical protein
MKDCAMRLTRAEVTAAIAAYVTRKLGLEGGAYEVTTEYRVDLQFDPDTTVPRVEFAGAEVLVLPARAPAVAAAAAPAAGTPAE